MINFLTQFAATCQPKGTIGGIFPTWYKYLDGQSADALGVTGTCVPKLSGLSDVWLVVAAVIEIMLRIAALLAVGFVVTGGVRFITSSGEPEKAAQARMTTINALIGLVIAIASATVVSFIARSFK